VDYPARREALRELDRERLPLGVAAAAGRDAFDDGFWTRLRIAFTDAEIVDLGVSVAKWLALGRINAVFDLTVSCPIRMAPSAQQASRV
jgi:hypothetical protein